MRIRSAGPDDIADLARLNAEVHAIHLAAMPDIYRPASADAIEGWFRGVLGDAAVVVLVADEDDALGFYRALGYDTLLTRLTRPL